MVRQRERKVLRAVKAARASRHPNKYFLQNQMRFRKRGPFVRGVGARRDGGRGNTCFRALRRLLNVEKVIHIKVFVVPFSAVFASAQTIRCCSRSQRLKRAREVCHKSSEKSTTSSMPALSLNAITRVEFCSTKTVLKPEAICAQPQRPPVLLRQSSVARFARQTKRGVAAAEADSACAAC